MGNHQGKMFLTILTSVVLTTLIVGCGIMYYLTKQIAVSDKATNDKITTLEAQIKTLNDAKTSAVVETPIVTPTEDATTADWKNYTNTKYGFSLNFGDDWVGYQTKEIPSTSFQTAFIRFYLPTTDTNFNIAATIDGKRYASPFSIVVYTTAQWQTLQTSSELIPTLIQKGTQYVFAYSPWQDGPTDLTAKNLDIKKVISTFQFTK